MKFKNVFLFLFLQKQPNHKHCLLFKASQHGIERLEICDKEDDKNPKIITLENCVKITQEPPPANLIHVVTKSGTLTLNALNDNDLKKWVNALQSVAFKDKGTLPRNSVIEEDNDLYCTSYSDGVFTIRLLLSDTSVKCNLEAKTYVLHLTTTELQLKSMEENNAIVAKWPYRFIRKYGYRDGKFTFEAGRKCDTGEGVFSLEHSNPQEVFRCMAAKMKSMKKLISGDSGSLDCGEHQLNAALSMEAGSRSPLPPSPNHHSHSESDLNQSGHLIRGFLSSNDSLNNVSTSSSSIPLLKHTPHKPPRKSLGAMDNENRSTKSQKYSKSLSMSTETIKSGTIVLKTPPASESNKTLLSLVIPTSDSNTEVPPKLPIRNESKTNDERDYESIETITNAWKTRGIDDIKHTERITSPLDEIVDFAWQRTQSQVDGCDKRLVISPVESDVAMIDDNYDRLEFFPAKTKTSSDYKTVVTINSTAMKPTSTANDYEFIGPDISPCRLADDSYLGYGVLRKPTTSLNQVSDDEVLAHREYNGLDYAIVSKPKSV